MLGFEIKPSRSKSDGDGIDDSLEQPDSRLSRNFRGYPEDPHLNGARLMRGPARGVQPAQRRLPSLSGAQEKQTRDVSMNKMAKVCFGFQCRGECVCGRGPI